MNEVAVLPITGGYVVRPARPVLRPPPTPCWPAAHFPLRVIGRTLRRASAAAGPARASTVPVVAFRTFRALYAGEFIAAAIQDLHRFHGLRPEGRGSALPFPAHAGTFTARQASLDATDRSVAPPSRAFDAGLRPGPFPDRTASLLPGLLAVTRTGLTPAGDNELRTESDHVMSIPPGSCAHSRFVLKFGGDPELAQAT